MESPTPDLAQQLSILFRELGYRCSSAWIWIVCILSFVLGVTLSILCWERGGKSAEGGFRSFLRFRQLHFENLLHSLYILVSCFIAAWGLFLTLAGPFIGIVFLLIGLGLLLLMLPLLRLQYELFVLIYRALRRFCSDKADPQTPATKLGGRVCPACGRRLDPDESFCSACGFHLKKPAPRAERSEAVKPDVCLDCGAVLRPGASFCPSCGREIKP